MSKTLPADTNYTKNDIKKIICDIKQKGWLSLPPKWADKDGGGGEYIQYDHFHVKVNPQKIGDLGSYELKTHRSKGNSLVTLGSIDPKDESRGSLLHPLLLSYGFPYKGGDTTKFVCRDRKAGKKCKHSAFHYPNGLCYPDDEISLGVDICGKDVIDSPQNKWGFYLEINKEKKRVFMHFDPMRASSEKKYQDWLKIVENRNNGLRDFDEKYSLSFDEIEKSAREKFHNMVFIKYLEKIENGKKFIKVEEAYFLEKFNFEKYLAALEKGEVMYELRLHGNKERISKNHGTGFRMFERNFPAIFDIKEPID